MTAGDGERGSIMVLAVWILVMLTFFLAAVHFQVRGRLRYVQQMEIRDKLRGIAEAGIKKARLEAELSGKNSFDGINAQWANDPSTYQNQPLRDGRYSVSYATSGGEILYGMTDEGSRINLNEVKSERILQSLFSALGVEGSEASNLAASVLDWRDEDDVLNAGGAESRYYRLLSPPYLAKNKPFDTVEEMYLVKGVTPEIYKTIAPFLTVDGHLPLNLNTAPALVLKAYGLSEKLTTAIEAYRAGRDGRSGTADDRVFDNKESIPDALDKVLSLPDSEKDSLSDFVHSGLLGVRTRTFRAQVTAHLEHRREALVRTCVFERGGALLRCQEDFKVEDSAWEDQPGEQGSRKEKL